MLRVPTRLAPSPIHGLGVFAARPIRRGEVVWAFDAPVDQRLPWAAVEAAPDHVRRFVEGFGLRDGDEVVLPGDDARFINHSYQPNLDSKGPTTVAAKDIAEGEELTDDYATTPF